MTLKLAFCRGLCLSWLAYSLMAGSAGRCQAEDWPTFRGADRTAVSPETGLLKSWADDGPELLWTAKGAGRGYASPAVADGRVYTLGDGPSTADGDKDEYLTCFDASNGKQLWKTKTGPAWNSGKDSWQGSRATPTVEGDLLWVVTPFGKLVCAKSDSGDLVWQRDLKEDFDGKKKDSWGYSESPLVDGDKVICTPGGPDTTVVALEKTTGKTIWKCSRPGDVGAGHASVVISQVDGRKIYVQNTGGGPLGIDAETGALLWDYDMDPPTAFIPTPIVKDEYVFAVAGYKLGGALLKQVVKSDGSVAVEEIYDAETKLGNKHGGVILLGDKLYFGVEDQALVRCADLMTGEVVWTERGSGKNSISIAYADDRLYLRYQNGLMAIAKIGPDGYEQTGSFQTPGSGDSSKPSWAHPVIANGKLFLREDDAILCYDISK